MRPLVLLLGVSLATAAGCRLDALLGGRPDGGLPDVADASRDTRDPALPQLLARGGGEAQDVARALALDGKGNLLVAGSFQGTARFGEWTLTTAHARGTVVAKLDATGRFLWARPLGGCDRDKPQALAIDSDGNAVVATSFSGSATLDGVTRTADGPADLLVVKLDGTGKVLWAATAPRGDPATDHGLGIAVGPAGVITVTGAFETTARFGATTIASTGDAEVFVASLRADGEWRWAQPGGGVLADGAAAVAVDAAGQSLITGTFTGEATFGSRTVRINPEFVPGQLWEPNQPVTPTTDGFIAALDPGGTFLWARRLGFASAVRSQAVALSASGSVTMAGASCWNNCRSFVARVDASGDLLWHLRDVDAVGLNPAGEQSRTGHGIAVDAKGASVVTGRIAGSAHFGDTLLTALGESDAFVAQVDAAGSTFLRAHSLGGVGADAGHAVALDAAGNAFVAGAVSDTANLFAAGDLAVWKLAP